MGSCDNLIEVHEPLPRTSIEQQHCCSKAVQICDSKQLPPPCLETGQDFAPASALNGCLDLSRNDNTVSLCSSGGMETLLVDRVDGLAAGEGETAVSLILGKLLGNECEVSQDMLDSGKTGIVDSSKEVDSRDESDGLVNSLENCGGTLELPIVSVCQKDEQKDGTVSAVQEGIEEKSDFSLKIEPHCCDQIAHSPCCQMPTDLARVGGSPIHDAKQEKPDKVAASETAIEDRFIDHGAGHESTTVPSSHCVVEDALKIDQIEITRCFATNGVVEVMKENIDVSTEPETTPNQSSSLQAFEKSLDSTPVVGSPKKFVERDDENDDKPVSTPSDLVVMEMQNDISLRVETVTSQNMSRSHDSETHSEPLHQQNEVEMQTICVSATEIDLDTHGDTSARKEAELCNQILPHRDDMPLELSQDAHQVSNSDQEDNVNDGKGVDFFSSERIHEIERCIEPSQACQMTLGDATTDGAVRNGLQQIEQKDDSLLDCTSTVSVPEVVERKKNGETDEKVEICSQISCVGRNALDQKKVAHEVPHDCYVNKSFSPRSCEPFIVDESVSSERLCLLMKDANDGISFTNAVECTLNNNERKDLSRSNCVSETKFPDMEPSSSQKSGQTHKSSRRTQKKRATRKCKTKMHNDEIVETVSRAPRSKRNSSQPARSSTWGSSITFSEIASHGPEKLKAGKGNRKGTGSQVGGSSQMSGGKNHSSTTRIRLKVKVGKEICQSSLNGVIPHVIDASASTGLVISDFQTVPYQECSLEAANVTNGVDKAGAVEGGTEKQFIYLDNKLEMAKTYPGASALDSHHEDNLESAVISEKSAGDASEDYIRVPSQTEVEQLGEAIDKSYADPGTSPDSEVINLPPEGHITGSCHELPDAILTYSKRSAGDGAKKKDRLSCADNPSLKDGSSFAANMSETKPKKKRGNRQRKDDGEVEVLKEDLKVEVDMETKICSDVDVDPDLSNSLNVKNGHPSTKSKVRQPRRNSNKAGKKMSKSNDLDRRKKKNGYRQRENDQKSISKSKLKETIAYDHFINKEADDLERGNCIVDDIGKTDMVEDVSIAANLDMASCSILERSLPVDNAWVSCDDCHKWRRIPVALVDSIGQTNCQWVCNDNMDEAFSDCSIPQEKSNAEINTELGISDVDEDACDTALNNKGLEYMHATASKEYEFTRISTNQFLHRSRKTQTIDEIMVCHCKPPLDGRLGCGDECLNRMLNIECVQGTCPCGDLCSNQQFQKRTYARMKWDRCGKKGFGLRSQENISKGQFLIEYVGEVLDMPTYEARQREYASKGHKHFYFMTLDGSEVIDACAKGNLGRFINHSCDPNCRTEKWLVNGEICIGLFALRDIKKGEEVTFDYNYVRVFGAAAKRCYCGSHQCRGYIGGDPTSTEVIDQVDSDEEFPEPVMLEEVEARDGFKRAISRSYSLDHRELQASDSISKNRDQMVNSRKDVGKLELMNQSSGVISQFQPSLEMENVKGNFSSCGQPVEISLQGDVAGQTSSVQQDVSVEETTRKPSSSIQSLDKSSTEIHVTSPDGTINRKPKSASPDNKRVFFKSRFLIKTSRQPGSVKKEKSAVNSPNVNKVQITTNKSQVVPVKTKRLMEGASNGRFEAVEEKLNELLDDDGGISKRKDAPKGYLKLLLHTAASGANKNGEAIQSNRDLSMILDAFLKTKSKVVLNDIINKNGLRMLHNMIKQYRRDFKKIPILRKVLKVVEFLVDRQILTLEHITGGPPCPGMESFRESMLSLTEHDDRQVHQIARSFRDRWFPRNGRKICYTDKDDGRLNFHRCLSGSKTSSSHNCWDDQGAKSASMPRTRKRKTRWDQPADGNTFSLRLAKQKVESGLSQQSDCNPLPDSGKQGLGHAGKVSREDTCYPLDDVPPGFSSPLDSNLVSSNASSTISDPSPQYTGHLTCPADGVVGHPQKKFNSRLPVSYGIPIPIIHQFGSPNDDTKSWVIAPGMPFYPFPPLPPFPRHKKETPPMTPTSMSVDENAEGKQGCIDSATCHPTENNPSAITGTNQPDTVSPNADGVNSFKRPRSPRGSSNDLSRRYFKQQKCFIPPWVRKRNGWDT